MKNSVPKPKPPTGLSPAPKRWWLAVQRDFAIEDPAGLELLCGASQCLDRIREARATIKAEGLFTTDRFGQRRSHPAVLIERDARTGFLASLRALHLDLEPVATVGRPLGSINSKLRVM